MAQKKTLFQEFTKGIIKENPVPFDSLLITDGNKVLAIIYNHEIPELVDWMKQLIKYHG